VKEKKRRPFFSFFFSFPSSKAPPSFRILVPALPARKQRPKKGIDKEGEATKRNWQEWQESLEEE